MRTGLLGGEAGVVKVAFLKPRQGAGWVGSRSEGSRESPKIGPTALKNYSTNLISLKFPLITMKVRVSMATHEQ